MKLLVLLFLPFVFAQQSARLGPPIEDVKRSEAIDDVYYDSPNGDNYPEPPNDYNPNEYNPNEYNQNEYIPNLTGQRGSGRSRESVGPLRSNQAGSLGGAGVGPSNDYQPLPRQHEQPSNAGMGFANRPVNPNNQRGPNQPISNQYGNNFGQNKLEEVNQAERQPNNGFFGLGGQNNWLSNIGQAMDGLFENRRCCKQCGIFELMCFSFCNPNC